MNLASLYIYLYIIRGEVVDEKKEVLGREVALGRCTSKKNV